jgi:hypothetical protein
MTINLSSDWTCQADRAATTPRQDRRELADAGAFWRNLDVTVKTALRPKLAL